MIEFTHKGKTYKRDPQKYVEKWKKWALEPSTDDDDTIVKNIQWLYEQTGLEKTPVVVCRNLSEFVRNVGTLAGPAWLSHRSTTSASINTSIRASIDALIQVPINASIGEPVRTSVHKYVFRPVLVLISGLVGAPVLDSVWGSASVKCDGGCYFWADDLAYADFFAGTEILNDTLLEQYKNALADTCAQEMSLDKAVVLVKPKVHRATNGKLHRTDGYAVEWNHNNTTEGFYYLHGVRFEQELWKKVVSKKITFKDAMSIENIEQRMACLKEIDADDLLNGANAKKIDESERGNALYKIDGLFDEPAYFLRYECPSTGRVYLSGIDPEVGEQKDADACMAWKHWLSKEAYQMLKPLVTES